MTEPLQSLEPETRFRRLLEDYGEKLRRSIARLCPRRLGIRPEDIEQEVRLRLWRATLSETEIANPASYVYRTVATATIDAMRRVSGRREEPLSSGEAPDDETQQPMMQRPLTAAGPSPEQEAEQRQVLQKVEEALAQFPQERRRAIGLRLQGFTIQEIAEVLGWTEPKTRNLVHRGLQELRERLREENIEYEAD